ncbi:MAG: ribonuclease P protein component [Patescibacteria group bacterium]
MLARKFRLPRETFSEIQKSKQFSGNKSFILRTAKSNDGPKFAVTVSKKVSKSAVVRNTLRRRTYSVINDFLPSLFPGLYLFIAKPGAEKIRGVTLREEVSSLLNPFKRR